ncbi:MAG: NADH-quinone oxidoreductase subunit N [Planctomycetota bacterium]|nr:NADH-quinone oxidoreductase subunit N [Planctomycetota bacterium]
MNLHELISDLIRDTRGVEGAGIFGFSPDSSIGVFLPELVLCATIVLLLLVRILSSGRRVDSFWLAFAGSGVALYFAAIHIHAPQFSHRMEFFTGMLVYDTFTVFMRSILLLFLVLFTIFTKLSGIPHREDGQDIYTLVFGSTVGLCLMTSANHLMMVFMAVEMASVPSYALAGLLKGRKLASEASLKYAVYGAGAAGVMLYGISLITGIANSASLPVIARVLAERLPTMPGDEQMVLVLGGLMLGVGLAFKLSAVPFHFWCPDVFEGATAEIDAFLSVASKAAGLALLVRVAIGLGVVVSPALQAGQAARAAQPQLNATPASYQAVAGPRNSHLVASTVLDGDHPGAETRVAAASQVPSFIGKLIALLAIVTCTFGNLAAYGQTNIKRLLAYSTIAHAGYMMMAVPPVMALAAMDAVAAGEAVAGLAVYITVYLFMNLGAFAVVAFLRNAMHSEEIADYAGLIRQAPGVVICFAIMLLSLIGLPPLSGFIGKFAIFASLAQGYWLTSERYLLLLLFVGGVNTVISLFYYLRIVKIMTIDPAAETRGQFALPLVSLPGMFLFLVTLPTAVLMIFGWDFLNGLALTAATQLLG